MKKTLQLLVLFAIIPAWLILMTGCASMRDSLYRPVTSTIEVPEQVVTNYVSLRTNTVVIPAVLDSAGNVLTGEQTVEQVEELPAPVPIVVTNPATRLVLTNGWERRPEVFETANIVATALPGWGTLAAGLFGAAGTIGAAWLNRKQKGTEAALVGTIQGIEEIRRALQQTPEGRKLDANFVDALQRAQRDHNALEIVQRLVELHTGYTRDQVDLGRIITPTTKAA